MITSLHQNIAVFSVELFASRFFDEFYKTFCHRLHGSVGIYDLAVEYATALTEWEYANGGIVSYECFGLDWYGVVGAFLMSFCRKPPPIKVFRKIPVILSPSKFGL